MYAIKNAIGLYYNVMGGWGLYSSGTLLFTLWGDAQRWLDNRPDVASLWTGIARV